MDTITILDPRGEETAEAVDLAPRLVNLKGKKLGIVLDGPWRSWYVFSDRMEEIIADSGEETQVERLELESAGAGFSRAGVKHKEHGLPPTDKAKLVEFAGMVDAVVVGLGN